MDQNTLRKCIRGVVQVEKNICVATSPLVMDSHNFQPKLFGFSHYTSLYSVPHVAYVGNRLIVTFCVQRRCLYVIYVY